MMDNLLQKLEERVTLLVAEVDEVRKELYRVRQENASLKAEKDIQKQKLQSLISLLDAFDVNQDRMFVEDNVIA